MGSQEPDDPHAMVLHHFGMSCKVSLICRRELETGYGEDDWEIWVNLLQDTLYRKC